MIGIISVTEKGDFIGDKLKDFFFENNISFKGIYKSKCEDFSLKEPHRKCLKLVRVLFL